MNEVFQSPAALIGTENTYPSVFITDVEEIDPFSFRDITSIFKKKDRGTSPSESNNSSSDSGSSSSNSGGTGTSGSGTGASIITGLFSVLGGLAPVLPQIGIGSKSRIAETKAMAEANSMVYNAQLAATLAEQEAEAKSKKEIEKMLLIGGVILFLVLIISFAFRR